MSSSINLESFNLGSAVNSGDGDNLRAAFQKVNDNFTAVKNGVLDVGTSNNTIAAGNDSRIVSSIQKVATMAALRGLPIPTSANSGHIYLQGYYNVGDGGGGDFVWDGAFNFVSPTAVNIVNAGSGYTIGTLLGISAPSPYSATYVYVTTVNGSGGITAVSLCPGSSYAIFPAGSSYSSYGITNGTGATFSINGGTIFDNGGTIINPTGHTGTGRWRRIEAMAGSAIVNVQWFGAMPNGTDCLSKINQAIWSGQDNDYQATSFPGAAGSGHSKRVTVYFPAHSANTSYAVSGTIYATAEMRFKGDIIANSTISLIPGSAPNATVPVWVIQYGYGSNELGQPNTTFNTAVENIYIITNGNAGGCGLYYVGCNGGTLKTVGTNSDLYGIFVSSGGVILENINTTGGQGPALILTGQQIYCNYIDAEHINSNYTGNAVKFTSSLLHTAANTVNIYDGNINGIGTIVGMYIPAVLIQGEDIHIQGLTGETSPIILLCAGAVNVTVESLSGNCYSPNPPQAGAGDTIAGCSLVKIYQCDNIKINHFYNQSSASYVDGALTDFRNDGSNTWNISDNGSFGGRGSYNQQDHIKTLIVDQLTVTSGSATSLPFITNTVRIDSPSYLQVVGDSGDLSASFGTNFGSAGYSSSIALSPTDNSGFSIRLKGYWNQSDSVGGHEALRYQIGNYVANTYSQYAEFGNFGLSVNGQITSSGFPILRNVTKPTSSTSAGLPGDVYIDNTNNRTVFYVGDGTTHLWKQTSLSTYTP